MQIHWLPNFKIIKSVYWQNQFFVPFPLSCAVSCGNTLPNSLVCSCCKRCTIVTIWSAMEDTSWTRSTMRKDTVYNKLIRDSIVRYHGSPNLYEGVTRMVSYWVNVQTVNVVSNPYLIFTIKIISTIIHLSIINGIRVERGTVRK